METSWKVVMLTLILLAAASASPSPARCAEHLHMVRDRARAGPRRLGEEPPADIYRPVFRTRNGRNDPMVVRTGVGQRRR